MTSSSMPYKEFIKRVLADTVDGAGCPLTGTRCICENCCECHRMWHEYEERWGNKS